MLLVFGRFLVGSCARDRTVTIVIVSRMTYRKGIDILVNVIPLITKHFSESISKSPDGIPKVKFIIGGDGPKLIDLKVMVDRLSLENDVVYMLFVISFVETLASRESLRSAIIISW